MEDHASKEIKSHLDPESQAWMDADLIDLDDYPFEWGPKGEPAFKPSDGLRA